MVGVLQHNNLVMRHIPRDCSRKRGHGHHPKAPPCIKGNLLGITQFGKFLLRGKEIDLVTLRHPERTEHFVGRRQLSRLPLNQRRQGNGLGVKTNGVVLCHGMNARIGIFYQRMETGHLSVVFFGPTSNAEIKHGIYGPYDVSNMGRLTRNSPRQLLHTSLVKPCICCRT